MVVEVFGVWHGLQEPTPLVERDFGQSPIPDTCPCVGFLRRQLDGHAVVRSSLRTRTGRCDDAVIVTGSQGDPGPDLVGPGFDLWMVGLRAEGQRRLTGRF